MRWGIAEPKKLLDAAFDPYRDQVASVQDPDGRQLGILVTYAEHIEELVGFRGLRPRWRRTEVFRGWHMPIEGRADEVWDLEAADMDACRWGDDHLRWLTGSEREAAWARYTDEWGPHESSHLRDG